MVRPRACGTRWRRYLARILSQRARCPRVLAYYGQADAGANGCTITGVLGESNRLTDKEREALVRTMAPTRLHHDPLARSPGTRELRGD